MAEVEVFGFVNAWTQLTFDMGFLAEAIMEVSCHCSRPGQWRPKFRANVDGGPADLITVIIEDYNGLTFFQETMMIYDALARDIRQFDEVLTRIGAAIPDDWPLARQFALTRAVLADRDSLAENDWLCKWQPHFRDYYDAQLVVTRLARAVAVLQSQPDGTLRKYLKTIFSGSLVQGSEPNQAKDFFYELWLASVFAEGGLQVELSEPDIVVCGNWLTTRFGVACKYPSSGKQVHEHLSKGYSQISRHTGDGVVAIGIDLVVSRSVLPAGVNFIDFRIGSKPPLPVLKKVVDEAMVGLVDARSLYPSEVLAVQSKQAQSTLHS